MTRCMTFALFVAIGAIVATDASAATIRVDINAPGPTHDGASWATACLHPQDAVDAAAGGDEVWVAEGTYARRGGADIVLLQMADGVSLYGGFDGSETLRGERDPAGHVTELDGMYVCEHVVYGSSDCEFNGFTVKRGRTDSEVYPGRNGAGMQNVSVLNLIIKNCVFTLNEADHLGGGLCNDDSTVVVTACTFDANEATGFGYGISHTPGVGGGASNFGGVYQYTDCVFTANEGDSCAGMFNSGAMTTTNRCTFVGNVGMGLKNSYSSEGTVSSCAFEGNDGSGIYNYQWSSPDIVNCVFVGNTGGGIRNWDDCHPTITNCSFYGNDSSQGDGIYNGRNASSVITNCILRDGGADEIYNSLADGGTCTVSYCNVQGGYIGAGNIDTDPLFVDAASGDLGLSAGSPCIDAADSDVAPSLDFYGMSRLDDASVADTGVGAVSFVDMGAFERGGVVPSPTVVLGAPDGGEDWGIGADCTVTWYAVLVTTVEVELSRDGGSTWQTLGTVDGSDQALTWTATGPASSACLVRVSDVQVAGPSDTSAAEFAVVTWDGVWRVDDDAPAGGNGLSWDAPLQHPQEAMDHSSAGQEVRVARGTYPLRLGIDTAVVTMADGVSLYGGFAGYGAPDPDQRDPAADVTVLDGQGACEHVVVCAPDGCLDGFLVTGGDGGSDGAGVFASWSTNLYIENCRIEGNTSSAAGGGAYVEHCSPTIVGCEFVDNTAANGGGAYFYYSTAIVKYCVFDSNTGTTSGGGARCMQCSPDFTGCAFIANTSDSGGGLHGFDSSCGVTDCSFVANTATYFGGGLYLRASTSLIVNCTLSRNVALRGGAICGWVSGSPRVRNCTLYGNQGTDYGGAFHGYDSNPQFHNSILWSNTSAAGSDLYEDGTSSFTVGHSLIAQVGGYTDAGGNIAVAPDFVDASGDEFHLRAFSAGIDAADNGVAPAADMEGASRHDDAGIANTGSGGITYVDMGAFEFQGDSILGSITGVILLVGGADPATISVAADGIPATTVIAGDRVTYTISGVLVGVGEVVVTTSQAGCQILGSPAPVVWAGVSGSVDDITIRLELLGILGGGCAPRAGEAAEAGASAAALVFVLWLCARAKRRHAVDARLRAFHPTGGK